MIYYSKSTGGFYDDEIHGKKIPSDSIEITLEQHAALMEAQEAGQRIIAGSNGPEATSQLPMTHDQFEKRLSLAIQQHLDATAQSLGYDGIASAATYADEPSVLSFQNEGKALRAWRSQVWAAAIVILNNVKSGSIAIPLSTDLIASLPAFVAP